MNNATCSLDIYVPIVTEVIYCFDQDYCYFGFSPIIQEDGLAGIAIETMTLTLPSSGTSLFSSVSDASPLAVGRLKSYFLHIGAPDVAFSSGYSQPTTLIMPSCAIQASHFYLEEHAMCPMEHQAINPSPSPPYLCSFWACMA